MSHEIQGAQPAQLPKGWRLQAVSDGDIRMYSPTGSTWLLRANTNEDFYEFIHGFLSDLMAATPAPEGALREAAQKALGLLSDPRWGTVPYMDSMVYEDAASVRNALSAVLAAPAPQAPVALTVQQIIDATVQIDVTQPAWIVKLARAIEAAHGITQTKEPTNDR